MGWGGWVGSRGGVERGEGRGGREGGGSSSVALSTVDY